MRPNLQAHKLGNLTQTILQCHARIDLNSHKVTACRMFREVDTTRFAATKFGKLDIKKTATNFK